jgi:hypothetical protein
MDTKRIQTYNKEGSVSSVEGFIKKALCMII